MLLICVMIMYQGCFTFDPVRLLVNDNADYYLHDKPQNTDPV